MAKKKSSKEIAAIRSRVADGKLAKGDSAFLLEIIDYAFELRKAIEASGAKSGGKTVLAKLPFGVDIVK